MRSAQGVGNCLHMIRTPAGRGKRGSGRAGTIFTANFARDALMLRRMSPRNQAYRARQNGVRYFDCAPPENRCVSRCACVRVRDAATLPPPPRWGVRCGVPFGSSRHAARGSTRSSSNHYWNLPAVSAIVKSKSASLAVSLMQSGSVRHETRQTPQRLARAVRREQYARSSWRDTSIASIVPAVGFDSYFILYSYFRTR